MRNGGTSWWWRWWLGGIPAPRAPLPGPADADVAIVGAGCTGLWAAYYLKTLQPDLRIIVLEQRFAGFGASGRNGGGLWHPHAARIHAAKLACGLAAAVERQGVVFHEDTRVTEIAFGGRGVPYRFGSRVDGDGSTHERTIRARNWEIEPLRWLAVQGIQLGSGHRGA